MSNAQMLRALVNQRLTAAAEEIFGLFERTITEYEKELCRSKEENERQRQLLDTVFKPQVRLQRADIRQLVNEEEVSSEQQELNPVPDQGEPTEPPQIKEEPEVFWTSQEGEELQQLEKLTFTPVKSELDEEKPQSSQFLHTELMKPVEQDFVGPEQSWNSDPLRHLKPDHVGKTHKSPKHYDISVADVIERPFSCSECGRRFRHKGHLQIHMRCHTGEKPFSCSVCGKKFPRKENLVRHMRFHSGEKPFSCSFCLKRFTRSDHAVSHSRIHTGEKPFSCYICGRSFTHKTSLKQHMTLHTKETVQLCCL